MKHLYITLAGMLTALCAEAENTTFPDWESAIQGQANATDTKEYPIKFHKGDVLSMNYYVSSEGDCDPLVIKLGDTELFRGGVIRNRAL